MQEGRQAYSWKESVSLIFFSSSGSAFTPTPPTYKTFQTQFKSKRKDMKLGLENCTIDVF